MKAGQFYGHFAAAYGTCWLVMLLLALITQSHIETGLFGLIGFPVIGLIYAALRAAPSEPAGDELHELRTRITELEDRIHHQGPTDPR